MGVRALSLRRFLGIFSAAVSLTLFGGSSSIGGGGTAATAVRSVEPLPPNAAANAERSVDVPEVADYEGEDRLESKTLHEVAAATSSLAQLLSTAAPGASSRQKHSVELSADGDVAEYRRDFWDAGEGVDFHESGTGAAFTIVVRFSVEETLSFLRVFIPLCGIVITRSPLPFPRYGNAARRRFAPPPAA